MAAVSRGRQQQFLATHPGHAERVRQIEANLPRELPLSLHEGVVRSSSATAPIRH
jgi:hypothetical protein